MRCNRRYERAAAVVAEMYKGRPVRTVAVASKMDVKYHHANYLLRRAKRDGLVQLITQKGWLPANGDAEAVS